MFLPEDIQNRLRTRPFQPLRVVTSTGDTYDIYHPDLVIVGQTFVAIGLPSSKNPETAENVTRVALMHITGMRDIVQPTPPNSN